MDTVEQPYDDDEPVMRFDLPKNFMIVGSTQSGKTEFVKRLLLEHEKMFRQKIALVIYCYGAWQKAFDELESKFTGIIRFRPDILSSEELTILRNEIGAEGEILLILDDKMATLRDNLQGLGVVETVCVTAHHSRVSCIILLQNVFHNKIVRELSLNTHYMCLFRNNRSESQVKTLASQIMPGQTTYFMDSYAKATAKPYSYLFIDLCPNSDKNTQLRTSIFPLEDMIVFTPKQ